MRSAGLGGLGVVELGERSARNFLSHRMTTHAAAIAYRGLFGLFPFMLLVALLLGVLHADDLFQPMLDGAGPAAQGGLFEELSPMFDEARDQAGGGLISFGVVVALYSVYTLARTLVEALNASYEVQETRAAWKRLLLLIAFGPALAGATIAATGAMLIGSSLAEQIAGLVGLDDVVVLLWSWLRLPVALLLVAVVLSIVYRFAPSVEQPYRLVTLGAAVAVFSWIVASLGFSVYLTNFADYGTTYGSLGAAIGLLFYLYLSTCVVLLGAEINATVRRHSLEGGVSPPR